MDGPRVSHVEHRVVDFTPAARERLESRMWNWARYMLDDPKTGARGRCGSAEWRHVAPKEADEVGAERIQRQTQEPIDIFDAGRIEDAVTNLRTHTQRAFLVSWFCYRSLPEVMARRYRVPELMLGHYLWAILGAVQYRLDHARVATCKGSRYNSP